MLSEVRTAVRRLAATPIFTGVAFLTITVALAGNTAIFSLADGVLFKPLPFKDPDNLWQVWSVQEAGASVPVVRPGIVAEWQKLDDVFEAIELHQFRAPTLIGAGEPHIVPAAVVGPGLMEMLGVPPLIGRALQPADAGPDHPPVIVIGEPLWRNRFGADPGIVGRRVRLDGESYEIVGVMPATFRFPRASRQIWMPLKWQPGAPPSPGQALARLRPGVSPAIAQERLEGVAKALHAEQPTPYGWRLRLRPFGEGGIAPGSRRALLALLGSVGLVLLLACANLAALMLIRGHARTRELAICAALGAGRRQLLRPLVLEAALITGLAAIVGALASAWLIDLLIRLAPRNLLAYSPNEVAIGMRVLGFTALLALATAALTGLLPGWRASHVQAADMLRAGLSDRAGQRQRRLNAVLVVGQLAVSVLLLTGAALLVRSFLAVTSVDPGFETDRVLSVELTIQDWKYPTPDARQQFFARLLDRLRSVPGVQRVSLSGGIPPGGGFSYGLYLTTDDGRVMEDDETALVMNDVDGDYFAALGLPLREGRSFTSEEVARHADAIVISEAFARRLWPTGTVAGRRFRWDDEGKWYTVVGVAGDVFQLDYTQPGAGFAAYQPLSEREPLIRAVVIRAHGDPAYLRELVKAAIREIDPDQPIWQMATGGEHYFGFFSTPRFYAYLMSIFAIVAVLLGTIGLYGVLSSATAQRTREFGIRLALGANPAGLRGMVLRQALLLMVIGSAIGVVASLYATRVVESLLVGVSRVDLPTYGVVLGLVLLTTLAACWLPARRASAVDPAVTLRSET